MLCQILRISNCSYGNDSNIDESQLGFALLSSGQTCLLELFTCGFKIGYTQLGFASLSSGLTGLLEL